MPLQISQKGIKPLLKVQIYIFSLNFGTMKVVIAPDKFKGTLSSDLAGEVICQAINKIAPENVVCKKFAVADGGDGSLAVLQGDMPIATCKAHDAVGRERECRYALAGDYALVESAEVIGLTHLAANELSPLTASSYGLGEVIADAVTRGARRVDIALGGVATCDCGVGMLRAMGVVFRDKNGEPSTSTITAYNDFHFIDTSEITNRYADIEFRVVCDVRNPLLGNNGAAEVYAPQKGASSEDIAKIEAFAEHLTMLVGSHSHKIAGSGAAGGLGWAMIEFLGAEILSGAEHIAEKCGLEEAIAEADLVITGEGRFDNQTEQGKAVSHIRALRNSYSKPCIIYCGDTLLRLPHLYALTDHHTKEEALSNAESLLYSLVCQTIEPYLLK